MLQALPGGASLPHAAASAGCESAAQRRDRAGSRIIAPGAARWPSLPAADAAVRRYDAFPCPPSPVACIL
jgi:hypothetical protein